MIVASQLRPEKRKALLAIGVGGLVAGIVDLLQAGILFGWNVPLFIAGGLLGREALHGGIPPYVLGVVLHFFIAFSAATVYYIASRRLELLRAHWLICCLVYGPAVEAVMTLVGLPLSALHYHWPYKRF